MQSCQAANLNEWDRLQDYTLYSSTIHMLPSPSLLFLHMLLIQLIITSIIGCLISCYVSFNVTCILHSNSSLFSHTQYKIFFFFFYSLEFRIIFLKKFQKQRVLWNGLFFYVKFINMSQLNIISAFRILRNHGYLFARTIYP